LFRSLFALVTTQCFHREGIDWCEVEWADNSECLDLIEKNMGLISLVNEESRFPKGTDQSMLQKLHAQHAVRTQRFRCALPALAFVFRSAVL